MMSKNLFIKILTVYTVFLTNKIYSQNNIELLVLQDARLAITEDKTGNYKPFTLDILTKLKLTGKQKETGFLVLSPFFEYAEIEGIYKRYGFDAGFTFNNSVVDGLTFTPSINYGIQDRGYDGKRISFLVFGADFEFGYQITDNLKVVALAQFVERKDLRYMYKDYVIRFSGFVGISYNIGKTNKIK